MVREPHWNRKRQRPNRPKRQADATGIDQTLRELCQETQKAKLMMPAINRLLVLIGASEKVTTATAGPMLILQLDGQMKFINGLLGYFYGQLCGAERVSRGAREDLQRNMRRPELVSFAQKLADQSARPQLLEAIKEYLIMTRLYALPSKRAYYQIYDEVSAELRNSPRPLAFLDIGCGIDSMDFLLLKKIPRNRHIVLLDPNGFVFDLLIALRKKIGRAAPANVKLIKSDFLNYAAPKGRRFDILLASLLLRYLNQEFRPAFFAKAATLMAPGGKLLIADSQQDLDDQAFEQDIRAFSAEQGFIVAGREEKNFERGQGSYFVYDLRLE